MYCFSEDNILIHIYWKFVIYVQGNDSSLVALMVSGVLFQPVFDELYQYIKNISSDVEQLSQMEKCILIEALILVW